jgi:molecular chaperone GrpE
MAKDKGNFFGKKGNPTSHDKPTATGAPTSERSEMNTENMAEVEEFIETGIRSDQTQQSTTGDTIADADKEQSSGKEQEYLEQINDLQDKYIRLMAEFDNFRKRTMKERTDLIKSAGEDILINILPVMDDFERGLAAMENSQDIDAIKQGVQLIYNKFKEFLSQKGVKEIDAMKENFNVDLHEAITKIPSPDQDLKGKVVDVIQKGYLLNDKVIRFSKVVVGE